ncbi:MAG: hypothetical protein QOF39_3262, partial [Frankiales bacterium]|nr:hypothetical protein [Frankiales bacterium]
MHQSSYARPRNLVAGTTAVAVAAAVWLVPATGHAGAVNKASSIGR